MRAPNSGITCGAALIAALLAATNARAEDNEIFVPLGAVAGATVGLVNLAFTAYDVALVARGEAPEKELRSPRLASWRSSWPRFRPYRSRSSRAIHCPCSRSRSGPLHCSCTGSGRSPPTGLRQCRQHSGAHRSSSRRRSHGPRTGGQSACSAASKDARRRLASRRIELSLDRFSRHTTARTAVTRRARPKHWSLARGRRPAESE